MKQVLNLSFRFILCNGFLPRSIINIFCIKIRSIETLFYILDGFITTIALCAGAGTSVLKDVPADLYLTGEMLHHDVLDAVHKGISVILTNHSDSERGYLKVFASTLHDLLNKSVKVNVSECDADRSSKNGLIV